MLQLALFGAGLTPWSGPQGGARGPAGSGPAGLPQGGDGLLLGLSGEFQTLLGQLNPEMLSRLETLAAAGMSLPEAARSLLAEAAAGRPDGGRTALLEFEALLGGQGAAASPGRSPRPPGEVFAGLLETLPAASARATVPGPLPLSALVPALAPTMALPAGQELPRQLAGNLLDMGVPQPVTARGWDSAIGERLMWMVQGGRQTARLKLNPPHLGPLEVRVSVNQDQTSVSFLTQHAAVREALEAALPRLREMFDQQSLQLVRADIGDPNARQGDRPDGPPQRHAGGVAPWEADADAEVALPGPPSAIRVSESLVDLYA